MRVAVLTIDQRGSSDHAATDRVPATLDALSRPLRMPDLPWQLVLVSLVAAAPAWLAPR